jgi:hypothetical protein
LFAGNLIIPAQYHLKVQLPSSRRGGKNLTVAKHLISVQQLTVLVVEEEPQEEIEQPTTVRRLKIRPAQPGWKEPYDKIFTIGGTIRYQHDNQLCFQLEMTTTGTVTLDSIEIVFEELVSWSATDHQGKTRRSARTTLKIQELLPARTSVFREMGDGSFRTTWSSKWTLPPATLPDYAGSLIHRTHRISLDPLLDLKESRDRFDYEGGTILRIVTTGVKGFKSTPQNGWAPKWLVTVP